MESLRAPLRVVGTLTFDLEKGEVLAIDGKGEIRARESGLIFMPLYQNLGDDGFFIVEEIEPRI